MTDQLSGSVVIVGSGPSGCYTAAAIRKAAPTTEVVVIDALPTPFGLVRHGVAPDHQGMKSVTRQFDRVFRDGGARFVGGVRIGDDVSFNELTEHFDAVVVATGLPDDRPLDVPGADLPGVYGAGRIVRLLNSHPDADLRAGGVVPATGLGSDVAVVGTGNVAIDVVRLLAKPASELIGSDIDDDARALLCSQDVRRVQIFGRGTAEQAKWDASMLRELAAVSTVTLTVDGVLIGDPATATPSVQVDARFGVRLERIAASREHLDVTFDAAGASEVARFDSIITAVGFVGSLTPVPDTGGSRVFTVGGCGSGVLGNLASNRKAAHATAAAVLTSLSAGGARRAGWASFEAVLPRSVVDWSGWQRIDAAETARADAERCRRKFFSREELHAIGSWITRTVHQ